MIVTILSRYLLCSLSVPGRLRRSNWSTRIGSNTSADVSPHVARSPDVHCRRGRRRHRRRRRHGGQRHTPTCLPLRLHLRCRLQPSPPRPVSSFPAEPAAAVWAAPTCPSRRLRHRGRDRGRDHPSTHSTSSDPQNPQNPRLPQLPQLPYNLPGLHQPRPGPAPHPVQARGCVTEGADDAVLRRALRRNAGADPIILRNLL